MVMCRNCITNKNPIGNYFNETLIDFFLDETITDLDETVLDDTILINLDETTIDLDDTLLD